MKIRILLIVLFGLYAIPGISNIKLPNLIMDNMVLQQRSKVLLWGEQDANERITITTSWNNKTYTISSDHSGEFEVEVETIEAGGPYTILFKNSKEEKLLKNVMLGEVWLCGGQSNMDISFRGLANQPVAHALEHIMDSNYPNLRIYRVPRAFDFEVTNDVKGDWRVSTPNTAEIFSAIGFIFGRQLHKQLNVPVGIILSAWGGSKVEAWMSKEKLASHTEIRYAPEITNSNANRSPCLLFNAMINPLVRYKIKGALFYQGEGNVTNAPLYATLFPLMVEDWRERWKDNFPFYYVQLAPFGYHNMKWDSNGQEVARFREVQFNALKNIPNSYIVSTSDIGDEHTIHPPDKETVAKRLMYQVLATNYNYKSFEYNGPVYNRMDIVKNTITVYFDHARYGLYDSRNEVNGFEIAGPDKVFYPAQATIHRDPICIKLTADQVPNPVAVRYGFKNYFQGTLYNNYGLAAHPFRTDNW